MRIFVVLILSLLGISCAVHHPKPFAPSFKTPEETFETWRRSVENLDLETLITCYAASARAGIRKDIEKQTQEGLRSMQEETKQTNFKIEKVVFEKEKAYLRATRKLKNEADIEVLTMVKEGEDWKLLP